MTKKIPRYKDKEYLNRIAKKYNMPYEEVYLLTYIHSEDYIPLVIHSQPQCACCGCFHGDHCHIMPNWNLVPDYWSVSRGIPGEDLLKRWRESYEEEEEKNRLLKRR